MAILRIAKYPQDEKLLRQRCRPVLKVSDRTRKLIDDMIETMYDAGGVGLAAPQVYVPQRLFVYDIGEGPDALINPEVLHAEGDELGVEGCLSIPRLQGEVPRHTRVIVAGIDRQGKRVRIDATDYLARVFQHEIDHLNGVLFIDRAVPDSLRWISEEEEAARRSEARRQRVQPRSPAPARP